MPEEALERPFLSHEEEEDEKATGCCCFVCGNLLLLCTVTMAIAVGIICLAYYYVFQEHLSESNKNHVAVWQYAFPWETVAVTAASLATVNSLHHLYQHARYNDNPVHLKQTVIPILLIVPVYAFCAGSCILLEEKTKNFSVLLNVFREFYESFVLVSFMLFISEFWGGIKALAKKVSNDEMLVANVFPAVAKQADRAGYSSFGDFRVTPLARAPGSEFIGWTWFAILQYAAVMCLIISVTDIMWEFEVHELFGGIVTKDVVHTVGYVLRVVKSVSNLWAMFNLIILFEYLRESPETKPRMEKINPVSKLFCIKLIILFSMWQEMLFKGLARLDLLPVMAGVRLEYWKDQERNCDAAINFCVCLEVLLFSQWHRHAYPYDERWEAPDDDPERQKSFTGCSKFCRSTNIGAMIMDMNYLLSKRAKGQRNAITVIRKNYNNSNSTELEEDPQLKSDFNCFELNEAGEAPMAQLEFILVKSKIAKSWMQARNWLREVDHNNNQRISFKEFTDLLKRHRRQIGYDP